MSSRMMTRATGWKQTRGAARVRPAQRTCYRRSEKNEPNHRGRQGEIHRGNS